MATQDDRFLRITRGPLGDDEVILSSLSGREEISRLYSWQLDFVSTQLDLKASDLVAKSMTIEIDRHDKDDNPLPPRFVNGYINRFVAGDVVFASEQYYRHYRAELVPWLWFLTQTARCFVYFPESEEKSIFNIIQQVLQRAANELHVEAKFDLNGISDLNDRKVKHCVQYRETDFNFLSRIMEQYGVYYYFTQADGEHKMVLSQMKDYPTAVEKEITFPGNVSGAKMVDHITGWEHAYEFRAGKFAHTDYDFQNPSANLNRTSDKISLDLPESAKYEVYDFPGEYVQPGDGESDARVRQEEEEVAHNTVRASSRCRTLMPGHTFTLTNHPSGQHVSEQNVSYLVTSIQHTATQPGPTAGSGEVASYSNSFTCVPDSIQFRPARITPKPVVSGVSTAVVVGPKGEEIHTDKYGRIKVAFHWDREDSDREQPGRKKIDNGEKFFCWVRVAQNIAGNKWGFMAIPRIGQEVVVDFLEGDPDRPLVIGSVYNEEQMPHYDPEEHKTKTYIKTNSSKGGDGFNELMFEDKADQERVFIHAQKNMDTRVRNDSKSRIYGNRHQIIGWEKDGDKGGDQRELVWQDKHLTVKRHQAEKIEGNYQLCIGNGDSEDGGKLDIVVEKQETKSIGEEGLHLTVAGDVNESIAGKFSQSVSGDRHEKVTGAFAVQTESGDVYIKSGMNLVIEASTMLTLKVGGNFVAISPAGVNIVGTLVNINSGGAAGSGSAPQPTEPAEAVEAAPTEPSQAHNSTTGGKSCV